MKFGKIIHANRENQRKWEACWELAPGKLEGLTVVALARVYIFMLQS